MMERRPCRVILVGMMGSGKTTVGHVLSGRTGWPYHDNDSLLHSTTGRTARQLLHAGAAALRRAEAAATRHALALPEPAIVACAAGTVTDPELRTEMRRSGVVVWLRASATLLAERAAGSAHRPWLEGDAVEWLKEANDEREPLYREVAAITLETGSAGPGQLVDQLLERLADTRCHRFLDGHVAADFEYPARLPRSAT